jgi:FG-GAP repeat
LAIEDDSRLLTFGTALAIGNSRLVIGTSKFSLHDAFNPQPSNLLSPTIGTVYLATIDQEAGEVSIDLTLENVAASFLALSGDGSRVAVRASTGTDVRVYDILDGELKFSTNQSGKAKGGHISLSNDGNVLAVSSETFDKSKGHVATSRYDSNQWIPVGHLYGSYIGGGFGWSTAFSANGNRLAVSAPFEFGGVVRVYERLGEDEWSQLGQDIISEGTDDRFGQSIDLDEDGSALVVGAPGASAGGSSRGYVQVFDLNNRSQWVPRGDKMVGNGELDCLGNSVQITDNGYRVATSGSAVPRGLFIYDWEADFWGLYGSDAIGGLGLAMTRDGTCVVGGSLEYGKSQTFGQVKLFDVDVEQGKTSWPTQAPVPSPSPSFMPSRGRPSALPSSMPSASPSLFSQNDVVVSGCRCNALDECIDDEIQANDNNLTICLLLDTSGLAIVKMEDLSLNQGKMSIRLIENGKMKNSITFADLKDNRSFVSTRLPVLKTLIASICDNKFTVSGSVAVSYGEYVTLGVPFQFDMKLKAFSLSVRFFACFAAILLMVILYICCLKKRRRISPHRNWDCDVEASIEKPRSKIQNTLDESSGTGESPSTGDDLSQTDSEESLEV